MELKVRPTSAKVNPAPRSHRETENDHADIELQKIIDGIIDEEYLVKFCKTKNLHDVEHLELKVNTSYQSLVDLHNMLPSLKNLTLDRSTIISIRDLGVGLRHLSMLSLNDCSLSDIDGIGVLTGLQELRLRDNMITDVTPLAMHENIEVRNIPLHILEHRTNSDIESWC
jgi:Leucine-rich repeat (LRR) protein